MTLDQLSGVLTDLDTFLRIPRGLALLREMIRELAVTGLLVDQHPDEETGQQLLERVRTRTGASKPSTKLRTLEAPELAIGVPPTWAPTYLGWLAEAIVYGTSMKTSDRGDVPVLRMGNIQRQELELTNLKYLSATAELRNLMLAPGDLLFNRTNSRELVGKSAVVRHLEIPTTFASYLIRARFDDEVNPEFVNLWLGSSYGRRWARVVRNDAIGQSNINGTSLGAFVVGLPPKEEQDRIVYRFTELAHRIDEIETLLSAEEQARRQAMDAGFQALGVGELNAIAPAMSDLVVSVHDIRQLEGAIIELAISGQLVEQRLDEGSGDDLAKEVTLRKDGLATKRRAKTPIDWSEPFAIPDSWAWCTLGQLGEVNPRNDCDDGTEVSFVPMALISAQFGDGVGSERKKWRDVKRAFTHIADGDVVVAKITPCFENSKAAVISGLANGVGAATTELHVFRDVTRLIDPDFVYLWMKSPTFLNTGMTQMTGTAGQQRVPLDFVRDFPFPLPPLAEQRRIVKKTRELMALSRRARVALSKAV